MRLCTQYVDYDTTLILRFVAGLGAGFYTAVAVAGLGAHSKPREAFNWMLSGFCGLTIFRVAVDTAPDHEWHLPVLHCHICRHICLLCRLIPRAGSPAPTPGGRYSHTSQPAANPSRLGRNRLQLSSLTSTSEPIGPILSWLLKPLG